MSDTYSLVRIAYRTRGEDVTAAWHQLLWDRAVVNKVSERTLVLGDVLAAPGAQSGQVASAGRVAKEKIASHAGALTPVSGKRASVLPG